MKQKNLLKHLFLLIALLVGGVSNAWADVTGTINFGNASGSVNINDASVNGNDNQGNGWTITTVGTSSYTPQSTYSQVGSSNKPATSITFTMTLAEDQEITSFSAKFGGFNNTAGTVTLKIDDSTVGTGSLNATNDVVVSSSSSKTGKTLTVTVTDISKGVKAYYISYTYTSNPTVVEPKFSKGTGTYNTSQSITLSCDTDGATIHYTMTEDGTTPYDPTESDATFESAISVTKSGTIIKAKAFKTGMEASTVATATYTIKPTTPTITGGASVTITGDDGCTFYYTTATGDVEPATPNKNSTEYTAPFTPADGTKIKAVAYDAYGNKSDATSVFTFKYMPLAPKNYNTNFYVKVTDVNDLENGDAILIVCETHEQALSTTQNTNNRGATGVTIDGSGIIENPDNKVQKLILVKKTEKISDVNTDVFYFYTGSAGYLYAASNSSNHLKTEEAPDNNNNARATISISSGDATILFTGTNANKWLKHNYSGTSNLFSCYPTTNTTMDIVQIYKEVLTSVDVTDANYATYVTAYDIDFAASTGVTAYKVTGTDGKIELEEVDAAPKGTPLVIAATENTYELAVATSTPAAVTGNLLKAADGNQTGDGTGNFYVLGKDSQGKVGFGPLASGVTLAKGKAYINGDDVSAKTFLPFVIGDEEDETTSIKAVETAEVSGTVYNLAGQKVSKDYKGIVVVNGKKFVRK